MQTEQRERNSMKVIVRVRPLVRKETEEIESYQQFLQARKKSTCKGKLSAAALSFYAKYHNVRASEVIRTEKNCVSVYDQEYTNTERKMKDYLFSEVFETGQSNLDIFQHSIKPNVMGALQGYNCTILAYGITGSGKTFSVFGHPKQQTQKGICHLTFQYLLSCKRQIENQQGKVELKFSFLQIYNENIRDLLSQDGKKQVSIGEDGKGNTQLSEASEVSIKSVEQIVGLISAGTTRRTSAATQYNQISSRSHAVLKMQIQIVRDKQRINSKLFIIDLAGSEKIHLDNSQRKNQGSNINRSLLSLGNCITALVQNQKKAGNGHIPYRDSKLTRLLKDSLGGNARTVMIACISPYPFTLQETTTTLNYAERAQGIRKTVSRNVVSTQPLCSECGHRFGSLKTQEVFQENVFQEIMMSPGRVETLNQMDCNFSETFERLYNDILQNAREAQKIAKLKNMITKPMDGYDKICKQNEQQRIILKEILVSLVTEAVRNRKKINLVDANDELLIKPTKKKIKLCNSTRKQTKDVFNDKQNVPVFEFESDTKMKYRQSGGTLFQSDHNPPHSSEQSKDKMEQKRESITSQKKKRAKFEVVKKPPHYEPPRRPNSEKRSLTERQAIFQ